MKVGDRVRNRYDGNIGTIVTIFDGINQVIEVKFDKLEFVSVQTKKDVVGSGMKECEHIFSYQEGADEAWLNYKPKHPKDLCDGIDVIFNYCPLCGEKLELEEVE